MDTMAAACLFSYSSCETNHVYLNNLFHLLTTGYSVSPNPSPSYSGVPSLRSPAAHVMAAGYTRPTTHQAATAAAVVRTVLDQICDKQLWGADQQADRHREDVSYVLCLTLDGNI